MPTSKSAHLLLGVAIPNADALEAPYRNDFTKPNFYGVENCVGAYVFSKNKDRSLTNYANTAQPLTIIGKPTFGLKGAVVSRANCFDTGLLPTTGMTWVALLEDGGLLITNGGAIISSLTPVSITGTTYQRGDQLAIGTAGDGAVTYFNDRGGEIQIYGLAAGMVLPAGSPAAIAVSVDAQNEADGTIGKALSNTNTPHRTGTGTNSRTLYTGKTILIGSNQDLASTSTQYSGKSRIKAVAIYNRAYNSAELNLIVNSVRAWALDVGMSI